MRNVLLITSDHMRHDVLGCNGNGFVQTPNLDRLSGLGVNFRNAFTPNPICVPARASITTGNYSHKATTSKANNGRILDNQPKIAEVFRNSGYATYAIGKLHYVPYAPPEEPRLLHGFEYAEITEEGRMISQFDPSGLLRGIEDYHDYLTDVGWGGYERAHGIGNNDIHPAPSPVPAEHYVDTWVKNRSIHILERHLRERKDQPFFLWTSFTKPHSPYDPPRPYDTLYDPREVPKPYGGPELLSEKSPILTRMRGNHGWERFSPGMVQLARAYYFAQVTYQDKMIGELMAFLEENGLWENTIVVYTSDHGDLLGDFGCFFKTNHLNGAVRVPMIMAAPGLLTGGRTSDHLAGLQDILPTVAALSGVSLEQSVDGMNLASVLSGQIEGRFVFISQSLESPWQTYMVCSHKWKYIYTEANGFEELYDVEDDPHELRNLALDSEYDEVKKQYRAVLIQWCQENGDEAVLDGNDLRKTEVDLDEVSRFNPGSMGWRWF